MDCRCKYTSKPCYNERSRKPSGEYHNFCDLHRMKANEAQRRWYTRHATGDKVREKKARKRMQDKLRRKKTVKIVDKEDRRGGSAATFRDDPMASSVLSTEPSISLFHWHEPSTTPVPRCSVSVSHVYEQHLSSSESPQLSQWPHSSLCDPIALPLSVDVEAFSLESDWPLQGPASCHNDELMSLFASAQQDDNYVGMLEDLSNGVYATF